MTHAVAKVNGVVVAETDAFEVVEGNVYFPPSSLKQTYYTSTSTTTRCPWKGSANYYTISVDGKTLKDAAWHYDNPSEAASNIKGYVAFYPNKVQVSTS
ncbi:DUF427-domain-containing protein [Patellaria atrata CBS 101060]|uniref:DUF427-domain-containing protein n=1 Tax=Patellaria atrata CBS 101060 TaxID=1346257 RepID=A0A9P4S397_9PEZI|nr:DUF427-domain-containing protein [Patellaria atrata CBS 101060]